MTVLESVCVGTLAHIYLPNPVNVNESPSLLPCRCSMSVEDGAKLYDVCPHVSDSVCSHKVLSVTSCASAMDRTAVSQGSDPFTTSSCLDTNGWFIVCWLALKLTFYKVPWRKMFYLFWITMRTMQFWITEKLLWKKSALWLDLQISCIVLYIIQNKTSYISVHISRYSVYFKKKMLLYTVYWI